MAALFNYIVRYNVDAKCRTPLRTAAESGAADCILRTADGCPFLPGTSLAGALRAWIADEEMANALFGSQKKESSLIISDGIFNDKTVSQVVRPRLRINGATGTAETGHKFDVAVLATGEEFSFTITWKGGDADSEELAWIEGMLAALHAGEIRFGAQKTNGFGQVSISVTKQTFDLSDKNARNAWLNDNGEYNKQSLQLHPVAMKSSQVVFVLTGIMENVLVKGAASREEGKGRVAVNIRENGSSLIPGSSVKGAIRNRVEMIAAYLKIEKEYTDEMFGREPLPNDKNDNGLAGRVYFSDVVIKAVDGEIDKKKISRIRIDSFTGGVIRQGLFFEEPVRGMVELKIMVPNEPQICKLIFFALRDLGLELYGLGSGAAIGRGFIKAAELKINVPTEKTASLNFSKKIMIDPDELVNGWLVSGGESFDRT